MLVADLYTAGMIDVHRVIDPVAAVDVALLHRLIDRVKAIA